jgi:hypothetical protein
MDTGDITIRTDPPGAEIYVDSILATDTEGNCLVTPIKLTLEEGMHRFLFTLAGYYDNWEQIYIYRGSDIELNRNLMFAPVPGGSTTNVEFM